MKKLLFAITTVIVLVSCKTSKDYLSRSQDEKTLFDIVKQLNKHSDDANAVQALPQVYTILQQKHLKNIEKHNSSTDLGRWDKITSAYNSLQSMYDAVDNSFAASGLIKAVSYEKEIAAVKETAAEDYYQTGLAYFEKNNREDARKAYTHFKKADSWVKDYKDAKAKMNEAFENSIVFSQCDVAQ